MYYLYLMIITITITAALIAMICDAKATDSHKLQVRRLHRKMVAIKKANEATQMDVMYYTNQVSK